MYNYRLWIFGISAISLVHLSPFPALADCPPKAKGFSLRNISSGSRYYVSWEDGEFKKCERHSITHVPHLTRYGEPARVCGDKYFNETFSYIFTKSGGRFKTSSVNSAALEDECTQSGNTFIKSSSRTLDYKIEYTSQRFRLKIVYTTEKVQHKIIF